MANLVDVRPGERTAVATAMATLLTSTAGHMMLETARDALFLAKLPPSTLPWMYLAIAALGLAISRLIPVRRASRTASLAMLVAAAVGALFWATQGGGGAAGLVALFIWTGTFGAIVNVELWLLLGAAFDVGQAKRLFGLIGAGAVLGATLGAFVARMIASSLGARPLLLAAAVAFALAFVPALLLERKVDKITAGYDEPKAAPAPKASLIADLRSTAKDPYLLKIGVFSLLGTITLAIGDYLFKATMAAAVPKEELATAFATAYLAFNGISLVVQVGLTSFALRWLGVKRALYVLPALVVLGAAGVVVVPTLGAAIALRSADGALRHSLHKTATELLFLPLSDLERRRGKPVLDLVAQRGGQALSALCILALVSLGGDRRVLAGVAIGLGALWIASAAQVGAPYVDAFRRRLRRGAIEIDERIPALDLGALEALFAALNSSKDAEVMGAIDLLANQGRVRLLPALLLYHPSKDVVLRSLRLMVDAGRDDFLPIAERLLEHADPEIRAAALRARAEVLKDRAELEARATDPRPELRATAIVGLVAIGALDEAAARERLRGMSSHEDHAVALAVVRAMGASPSPIFLDDLVALALGDAQAAVKAEAAAALGDLGAAYPQVAGAAMRGVLPLLPMRIEGPSARAACEKIGEPAILALDAFLSSPEGRGPIAWAAVRALADFDGQPVAARILAHLRGSKDGIVRYRALKHLKRMRSEDPSLAIDVRALTEVAGTTLADAIDLLELRVLAERGQREASVRTAAAQLLLALLDDKRSHAMGRLFALLGLLHPQEDFDRVSRGLASKDNRLRASSRELCQNVIGPELRERVLILIDDVGDPEKVERALGKERRVKTGYQDVLAELAGRSGELGGLARYQARELGLEVAAPVRSAKDEETEFSQRIPDERPIPVKELHALS